MSQDHEARFLEKLDEQLPIQSKSRFSWMQMAASIVVILGLSFGAFKMFNTPVTLSDTTQKAVATKTLGDISPDLKKVEDYYLANINLELSKLKLTDQNKELFDGYLKRLTELNTEYNLLSKELTKTGPNEFAVNALINNLKLRLNLLQRLKDQLNKINSSETKKEII